jgi:hypothetical protein
MPIFGTIMAKAWTSLPLAGQACTGKCDESSDRTGRYASNMARRLEPRGDNALYQWKFPVLQTTFGQHAMTLYAVATASQSNHGQMPMMARHEPAIGEQTCPT